jgi:hypothetical protein
MGFEVSKKEIHTVVSGLQHHVAEARVQSQVRLYGIRCGKEFRWGSCSLSTSSSPSSSHYTNCSIFINPTKTEFLLDNIQKFSSYVTGNILRRRYRYRSVNAVYGEKSLFTGRTIWSRVSVSYSKQCMWLPSGLNYSITGSRRSRYWRRRLKSKTNRKCNTLQYGRLLPTFPVKRTSFSAVNIRIICFSGILAPHPHQTNGAKTP